jgi:hypothetical protein
MRPSAVLSSRSAERYRQGRMMANSGISRRLAANAVNA